MTQKQFKKRWESGDDGGGITFDDVADCAKEWGVCDKPKIRSIDWVLREVLRAVGCEEVTL